MAPDHQYQEFKKLIGTRAHEARVPFSHVSPLPTLKPICYPQYQKRKEQRQNPQNSTHLASLSPSPLPEHVQTLTPSHHRWQRTLVGGRGLSSALNRSVRLQRLHSEPFTPIPSLRSTVLSFSLSLSLSLSFSIVKRRSLNQEKLQFFCFKSFNFLCGY